MFNVVGVHGSHLDVLQQAGLICPDRVLTRLGRTEQGILVRRLLVLGKQRCLVVITDVELLLLVNGLQELLGQCLELDSLLQGSHFLKAVLQWHHSFDGLPDRFDSEGLFDAFDSLELEQSVLAVGLAKPCTFSA